MNDIKILEIALPAIVLMTKLSAPLLIASMGVGLAISILQSVTQIQEFTLTFVPKLAAVGFVLLVGGNWMLRELVNSTTELFLQIPALVGAG